MLLTRMISRSQHAMNICQLLMAKLVFTNAASCTSDEADARQKHLLDPKRLRPILTATQILGHIVRIARSNSQCTLGLLKKAYV